MDPIYVSETDAKQVVNNSNSELPYICVMRLQCVDGEIQLFAASYSDHLYDSFQSIAKSYISEKMVIQTVGEILSNVENPPYAYGKVHAATQTDQHSEVNESNATNERLENAIEINEEVGGMNDEEFLDFLHNNDEEGEVEYVYSKDDIQADDLVKFVHEMYDENTEGDVIQQFNKYADCPYKCGFCEKTFTRHCYLESHIAVIHGNMGKNCFKCSYCDKPFEHKASLKKHFVTHVVDKPFKCRNHCTMTFGSKQQLQRHILIYKGIHSYVCKFCGKTWATKAGLKGHIVVHSTERAFQCNVCGKSFARKSQLTRHYLLHQNERKYICPLCGKTFLRAHDLTRHSNVHNMNQARPYTCDLCEKTFTKKAHLTRHNITHY